MQISRAVNDVCVRVWVWPRVWLWAPRIAKLFITQHKLNGAGCDLLPKPLAPKPTSIHSDAEYMHFDLNMVAWGGICDPYGVAERCGGGGGAAKVTFAPPPAALRTRLFRSGIGDLICGSHKSRTVDIHWQNATRK